MANDSPHLDTGNITIGSATNGKKLVGVQSFKVNDNSSKEPVFEVGNQYAVGTTRKPGEITIALEMIPRTRPDVDYQQLKDDDELFSITIAYAGGKKKGERWQYSCKCSKYEQPSGDNAGKFGATAELIVIGKPIRLSKGQA